MAARALVTSNTPVWRGLAEPVEIRVWPVAIGADFLIARTGHERERDAAEDLSEALGGLPLALEQAAAYIERLEIPLAEYRTRLAAEPMGMLDTKHDAPAEYNDKLTVAKTFALAIEEAGKLHPAAEPLLVYAAILAPEPIPLFLFSEARQKFGEPLASALAGDGLYEAVAALRAFASSIAKPCRTSTTQRSPPTRSASIALFARSRRRDERPRREKSCAARSSRLWPSFFRRTSSTIPKLGRGSAGSMRSRWHWSAALANRPLALKDRRAAC